MKNKTVPTRRYLTLGILFAITALACSIFNDGPSDADLRLTQEAAFDRMTQSAFVPSPVAQITSTPINSVIAPSHSPVPSSTVTPLADLGKTPTPTQTRGLTITVNKATPYDYNTQVMIEVFVKNTGSQTVTVLANQIIVADSNGKLENTRMYIAVDNTERLQQVTSFTVPLNSTVKIFLLAPTTCRPNLVVQYISTTETFAACP